MKNDDDFIHLPELYIQLGKLKTHLKNTYNLNINTMNNTDKHLKAGGYDDEKMAMINCDIIYEYAVKLDKMIDEDTELEEWVKSKIAKTEQMMASVKHAIIGVEKYKNYENGGELAKQQLLHIAKYAKTIIEILENKTQLMSWMESNLAICADYMDNIYHHLDYKMGNRAEDVKPNDIPGFEGMMADLSKLTIRAAKGAELKNKTKDIEKEIEELENKRKKLIEEYDKAKGAEKDKIYEKIKDIKIDIDYAKRDMYMAQEIEARNKMTIDFMKALEESKIMAAGSHKNKAAIDAIKSIISMSEREFAEYIKENPNAKIEMIYREFQDWKESYRDGGGVEMAAKGLELHGQKKTSKHYWNMFNRERRIEWLVSAGYSKSVAEDLSRESWDSLDKDAHKKLLSVLMADGGGVDKIEKVMREFKEGKLKTSAGQKVTNPKQAMAIALSESRRMKMRDGGGAGLTYTIKYWETEEDRDMGESQIYERLISNKEKAIEQADKLYRRMGYAAIEVEDSNGNLVQDWNAEEYRKGGGISEAPIAMYKEVKGKTFDVVERGEIHSSEVNDFVNYVNEFYGKNGLYADDLDGGFSKAEIKAACLKYIENLGNQQTWGGGDSVDRERVRQILQPSYSMFAGGGNVGYFKSGYTLRGRKGKYWIDDVEGRVTKDRYFEKEEDAIAEIDLLSRFKKLRNEQRVKGPSMENLMEADRYYATGGGVEDFNDNQNKLYNSLFNKFLSYFKKINYDKNSSITISLDYDEYFQNGNIRFLENGGYKDIVIGSNPFAEYNKKEYIENAKERIYELVYKKDLYANGGGVGENDYSYGYLVLWSSNAAPGIAATDKGGYTFYSPKALFENVVDDATEEEISKLKNLEMNKPISWGGYVETIEKIPFEMGSNMAANGMFLEGEFEEIVRKVQDYIAKYPYVWTRGNKRYVPIEGWQYAASLMGLSARVVDTYAVTEKNGWMSKAEVVNQHGAVTCGGFGFVGRDEEKWSKSTESELESFAQTKAVSRALRNCISYLIKAAGYSTTPAEEMYGLKGVSKTSTGGYKKPTLRPVYGVPDEDFIFDRPEYRPDIPAQKPIEMASTEERSSLSILLQKVWAEAKGRGMVIVSSEFMNRVEETLFDLSATDLVFELLLTEAYNWMIDNNVVLRSKIFMKEISKAVSGFRNQ